MRDTIFSMLGDLEEILDEVESWDDDEDESRIMVTSLIEDIQDTLNNMLRYLPR